MDSLTPEQKDLIEVFKTLVQESMEESLRSQQVHSIGGIPFGISLINMLVINCISTIEIQNIG